MTTEIELRKWLHRDYKSDIENIQFGIKVWNSIELNLFAKQEIITEEVCSILLNLAAKIETDDDIEKAWTIINEFFALKSSPGAVANSVKVTLITTLLDVLKQIQPPRHIVYKGLITLLQNTSMQSFFKSNLKLFAKFVGASLVCLLELSDSDCGFDVKDPFNFEIYKITNTYIKQIPYLKQFRKPFVKYLLCPLSEFFIRTRKHACIEESVYFNILHDIYFADDDTMSPFKELLLQPENENVKYLLDVPVHVFMLVCEGILQPFKVDSTTQALFIQLLFNVYFKQPTEKFVNEKQMLLALSYFLSTLKRYNVSLNFQIDGVKAIVYMGKNIQSLNITESNLHEILSVLCGSIELDPMMLEHMIVPIVVTCMLHRKDDKTAKMFENFLILVIEMYRRLSRSEKFISNLIRTMWQKLSEFKLSKKLKRKIGTIDSINKKTPKRSRFDSGGDDSISLNISIKDKPNERSHWFLQLLIEHLHPYDNKTLEPIFNDDIFEPWKNIQFAWPNSVGEAFSKFISGAVSKPSLVVWKTLNFTLTDYVQLLKDGNISENTLFLIDWISALMCQYFDGCRLAEQSDKTWDIIENNRKLQRNLLNNFGHAILSLEHNIRTMNAFLQLCYSTGNFDLLSWFYCPDSISTEQIERSMTDNSNDFVHSYLHPTEWILIEQRITNFGQHECRRNLNRLYVQKIKSKLMFKRLEKVDMSCNLLTSTLGHNDGANELFEILVDETMNQWFIERLTRSQKIDTARKIVEIDCTAAKHSQLTSLLVKSVNDQEFFDMLTVSVFERIALEAKDPMFVLKRVNFEDVFAGNESVCNEVLSEIKKSNFESTGEEQQSNITYKLLDLLPLGFVSLNMKNILLHFTLGLLRYASEGNIQRSCQHIKKLLFHGDTPDIFRFLKIEQLAKIFNNDFNITEEELEVIYQLFFEKSLNEMTPSTITMLNDLLEFLRYEKFEKLERCSFMDMGIRLLQYLNKNKKCKEYGTQFRDVILKKIRDFFDEQTSISHDSEKKFVAKTASGFVNIISTVTDFDDSMKRIIKVYVRYMEKCSDSHTIKLLNIIVTNKTVLGYADKEIADVISQFWNELIKNLDSDENPDVYLPFLKFVLYFQTTEELIDLLTKMYASNDVEQDVHRKFEKFEKLFRLIFKCQMNKAKGSIISEFFRQVSYQFIISLRNLPQTQSIIRQQLLECQRQLCTNIQIPVSTELIDDIISFMSETIKYQQLKKISNPSRLKETHTRISDLCYSMIQHRHYFIVDRIPQFVSIIKELLQSICWYKCDRLRGKDLDDDEVTMLAELSHNLENIVKAFVKHSKDVKRIAPYFLLYIIHLMISKENASTIYSKIKTHFDYICYDLISVCDHRVQSFIMRNCNEASKQLYETMVKEYNKYHKFKGKV